MSKTNELRGAYGHKMRDTFKHVGACVVWQNGGRFVDLCYVTPETIAWDGAASSTTHAVYSYRSDTFSYIELRVTGRSPRTHTGGVYGTKAMMRFTGADDSGEWIDVIVTNAETLAIAA